MSLNNSDVKLIESQRLTDNNDISLGCHLILTDSPKDKKVSVLFFNTASQTDDRLNASERIKGYVILLKANQELGSDPLEGQCSIVGYQRGDEPAVPEIGQVNKITTPDEQTSQFIWITAVDHSQATFPNHKGSQ